MNYLQSLVNHHQEKPLEIKTTCEFLRIEETLISTIKKRDQNEPQIGIVQLFHKDYLEFEIKKYTATDLHIGIADHDFPKNKHIGYTRRSIGINYHGQVFSAKQETQSCKKQTHHFEQFKESLIIGVGVNKFKKKVFFTQGNNVVVEYPFENLTNTVHTLSLSNSSAQCVIKVRENNFAFAINEYRNQETQLLFEQIKTVEIDHLAIHHLVENYLYTKGHFNTLMALQKATGIEEQKNFDRQPIQRRKSTFDDDYQSHYSGTRKDSMLSETDEKKMFSQALWENRIKLKDFILSGNIGEAIQFMGIEWQNCPDAKMQILGQYLIEILREKQLEQAIQFARQNLINCEGLFRCPNKTVNLEYLLTSFAYQDPLDSAVSHLFTNDQRLMTFQVINNHILAYNHISSISMIEELSLEIQQKNMLDIKIA